ncbi:DUF6794 domain-containing protein [Psychroserpens sp. BH13MA-6]
MCKIKFLLFVLLTFNFNAYSQKSTSRVPISTIISQNEIYSIKSISYDTDFPNLKGQSIVYENDKELYQINRSFDLYDSEKYSLAISNDGRTVIYLTNDLFWKGEEFEYVTVYRDGVLTKTYNMFEFTGCDSDREKCSFIYNNFYVVDNKKSKFGTKEYKKVFKENTSEEEIFLNENYIVLDNDILYLTDSRKIVTSFDLNKMEVISNTSFNEVYPKIKFFNKPKSSTNYYQASYKYIPDFVDTQTKKTISQTISDISGLMYTKKYKYALSRVTLTGYLNKNGEFEIEEFKCDEKLDKIKIQEFISNTTFENDFLPKEVEKQHFKYFFGGFRNANDSIAEVETKIANEKRRLEFKKRKTLDSIDGIYIPKNLYECITELDKKLNFESKKQLRESKSRWEFNSHMGGLGMWIRNNWGINGGSRLLKYFNDRGITDRDDISGTIIEYYQKWLLTEKDVWTKWENKNPKKE